MKNKGFNKQGLEKTGIKMNVNDNGVSLALPPSEAQRIAMEQYQKQQQEQQAQNQLNHLINYRATCAMNNLGCLMQKMGVDQCIYEELVIHAKRAAELLMVALKMIPNTDFFRELEKVQEGNFVKKEEEPASTIITE